MRPSFTHKNLGEVTDAAPAFGFADTQESRFASRDFGCEQTGFSHHYFKPGQRQGFGHRHERAEEVYFIVSGSGRMKLDEEIVELKPRDVIRVAPAVTRAFEAGEDGLEVLAFGQLLTSDRGEIVEDWWGKQ